MVFSGVFTQPGPEAVIGQSQHDTANVWQVGIESEIILSEGKMLWPKYRVRSFQARRYHVYVV